MLISHSDPTRLPTILQNPHIMADQSPSHSGMHDTCSSPSDAGTPSADPSTLQQDPSSTKTCTLDPSDARLDQYLLPRHVATVDKEALRVTSTLAMHLDLLCWALEECNSDPDCLRARILRAPVLYAKVTAHEAEKARQTAAGGVSSPSASSPVADQVAQLTRQLAERTQERDELQLLYDDASVTVAALQKNQGQLVTAEQERKRMEKLYRDAMLRPGPSAFVQWLERCHQGGGWDALRQAALHVETKGTTSGNYSNRLCVTCVPLSGPSPAPQSSGKVAASVKTQAPTAASTVTSLSKVTQPMSTSPRVTLSTSPRVTFSPSSTGSLAPRAAAAANKAQAAAAKHQNLPALDDDDDESNDGSSPDDADSAKRKRHLSPNEATPVKRTKSDTALPPPPAEPFFPPVPTAKVTVDGEFHHFPVHHTLAKALQPWWTYLRVQDYKALLLTRPWDKCWRQRVTDLHIWDASAEASPNAKLWLSDYLQAMYEHRKEMWERRHWLHMPSASTSPWSDIYTARKNACKRGDRVFIPLKHRLAHLEASGEIPTGILNDPALWHWVSTPLYWYPQYYTDLKRSLRIAEDAQPGLRFWLDVPRQHPFHTRGFATRYPAVMKTGADLDPAPVTSPASSHDQGTQGADDL